MGLSPAVSLCLPREVKSFTDGLVVKGTLKINSGRSDC